MAFPKSIVAARTLLTLIPTESAAEGVSPTALKFSPKVVLCITHAIKGTNANAK